MNPFENNQLYNDNVTTEAIVPDEELYGDNQPDVNLNMNIDHFDHPVEIKSGLSSVIGARSAQQDAARVDNEYMYIENNVFLAVMCDGMGGMSGGEIASNLCVSKMFEAFYCVNVKGRVPSFFKFMVENIDKMIYNLTDDKGRPMHSGSTLTSVIIEGSDLYWVSVGDSRIFIKRSNEMMCVTEDHNYGTILDKKARRGSRFGQLHGHRRSSLYRHQPLSLPAYERRHRSFVQRRALPRAVRTRNAENNQLLRQ